MLFLLYHSQLSQVITFQVTIIQGCGTLYEHSSLLWFNLSLPFMLTSTTESVRCSRVECKHALVVSSNEQGGWQVLCENFQPGHVEVIRDRFFTGNWHAPANSE